MTRYETGIGCAAGLPRMRIAACGLALALAAAASTPASAASLNGWQKTVTKLAKSLTAGMNSDRGFTVDYNANFADLDYAVILAPAPDGNTSSLNIVAKCPYNAADVIVTQGGEIPGFQKSGTFKFGASAKVPSDFFAVKALGAAKAGLSINRKKDVQYDFQDIALEQITEDAALQAVNKPACLAKLGRRDKVFVVRGHFVMRLLMAQAKDNAFDLNAELASSATTDPAKVGFDVGWTGKETWSLKQKAARPWFRIVGMLTKEPDGKFDFAVSKH